MRKNFLGCSRNALSSTTQEDDLEFFCIQVSKPKIKPFLVGTWYRPPGSTIETIAKFKSTLRELESYNLEVDCNVKEVKMTYYNNYFKDNSHNIRNTWRGINSMLGNQSKTITINEIESSSLTYESPRDISGILEKHFSEIGPTLAAEIPDTPIKCTDYIKPAEATYILKQITCTEIFSLINKLPLNKASGLDNISVRLLKEAAPIVTSSLTFIISLSIVTGPEEWKYARVFPVFKDGVKADPNNYRPISVLPVVSKLIEIVVFNQFYGYN